MAGDHQMENASLAIAAWEAVGNAWALGNRRRDPRGLARRIAAWALRADRCRRPHLDSRRSAHTRWPPKRWLLELLAEFGQPVGSSPGCCRTSTREPFFDALAPAIRALILTAPRIPRAIPARGAGSHRSHSESLRQLPAMTSKLLWQLARARFPDDTSDSHYRIVESRCRSSGMLRARAARSVDWTRPAHLGRFAVNSDQVD